MSDDLSRKIQERRQRFGQTNDNNNNNDDDKFNSRRNRFGKALNDTVKTAKSSIEVTNDIKVFTIINKINNYKHDTSNSTNSTNDYATTNDT